MLFLKSIKQKIEKKKKIILLMFQFGLDSVIINFLLSRTVNSVSIWSKFCYFLFSLMCIANSYYNLTNNSE